MIKLRIDVAAAERPARIGLIIVLVSLVGNPEISKRKNQRVDRLAGLVGERVYRAFGFLPLAIVENIDRAAVLAARRARSGRRMCSQMYLAQRCQGNNRWIEGYDHPF